jgi:phospholipid-binding lipoprotein MlaA
MKKIDLIILSLLSACSATVDEPDPHKEFNKDMFEFNMAVDENILKPTASAYRENVPDAARESISNFLNNLKEPFYIVNHMAACDVENAANSLFRFVINSTLGILGLCDVGDQAGLNKTETSHRATLRKWGIPTGDYLVLPLLGPSSTRDAIAEPVSWFIDPVGYFIGFPYMLAKGALSIINDRAENSELIDSTKKNSINLYSTAKSLYQQKYGDNNEEDADPSEESDD